MYHICRHFTAVIFVSSKFQRQRRVTQDVIIITIIHVIFYLD